MNSEKYIVRLSEEERLELQTIVKKLKGTSQKVNRAIALLHADADGPDWTNEQIAARTGLTLRSLSNLRKKLVTEGFEAAIHRKERLCPSFPKKLDGMLLRSIVLSILFFIPCDFSSGAEKSKEYFNAKVGLWYTVWWDSQERDPRFYEHHWVKETRVKPIKHGYYAADDPEKLKDDFQYFRRIGIDYLLLDDTNSHWNDAGNIAAHIDACFAVAAELGEKAPKICFAGGRPLIDGSADGMQVELDIFAAYAEKYPNETFRWKGKPLFVNFNIPENYGYQDKLERFTMRPAGGHTSEGLPVREKFELDRTGLYGWVFDVQYEPSEVYGITPGFSRSHNDLGTTMPPVSRENGQRYQREWLAAVKRKPEMIVISSWNDHAEETGIEAVELREKIPGRGEEDPFFYQKTTQGYLALKKGFLENWFYRGENESQVYQYRNNRLEKATDVDPREVVIVVPDDYFDWIGAGR